MKPGLSVLFVLICGICFSQTEKQKDSAIRNLAPIPDSAIVIYYATHIIWCCDKNGCAL